jgi:hypothetical protein
MGASIDMGAGIGIGMGAGMGKEEGSTLKEDDEDSIACCPMVLLFISLNLPPWL